MANSKKGKSQPKRWVACPIEEAYFGDDRKISRMERKRLSANDRSKYKKTDKTKYEESLKQEFENKFANRETFRGRVLSISSEGVIVDLDGTLFTCALRGLLKREKRHLKNLVTVGDFVIFEKKPDHEGLIIDIEPRQSTLSRADNLSRRKEQLIAANIDQVLITVSVMTPLLKPFLIDRYIIAARKGNMQPVIIINKIDLIENESNNDPVAKEQKELFLACIEAYKQADIPLIPLSATTGKGLDALQEIMKEKASVFSGQSGTGKSSLINAVTGRNLSTGATVQKTRKGAHTTTQAQLVRLECGGWCVDTPGIKSFGVWDLAPEELESYFTEIAEVGHDCKFPDCSHSHEKECAVIRAVEEGTIPRLRYESYEALLESIRQVHRRR